MEIIMENSQKINLLLKKAPGSYRFDELRMILEVLRGESGCPWDREQTHKSLRRDLIEETYEVVEAIDLDDDVLMREELGDLILQPVFHARIAEEEGKYNIDDVINDICEKLIHRHPHVFGNVSAETSAEVLKNWDAIKVEEKQRITVSSQLRAVPACFPALMRAQKIGKKAKCFDFNSPDEVLLKLDEEKNEVISAMEQDDREQIFDEVGDLLFTAVSLARKLGVDAEEALTHSTEKFLGRFELLEAECAGLGVDMQSASMKELDEIWDNIKHKNEN